MPDHYFTTRPNAASTPRIVTLALPDLTVDLRTDRGVFAASAVDQGTRYLLTDAPMPTPGDVVADVGCGYGPIAIVAALRGAGTVWAIDVNERALELCRANAESLDASAVKVATPDRVPPEVCFDVILSNPPIRIGKPALHEMCRRWLSRLKPGGWAVLVVQKHLGSDSLARWLAAEGWPTERLGSRSGYRLLRCQAPA